MRKNRNKASYLKFLIPLFIIFAIALGIYLVNSIKIKNIKCKSQYGPCSKEVEAFLKGLEDQRISSVRKNIRHIKEGLSIVDYGARYKLLDTYEVEIIERKPQYALSFDKSSDVLLIDNDGYILSFIKGTSLPIVKTNIQPGNTGEKVDDKTFFCLKLMSDLYNNYQVKEGEIKDDGFYVRLNTGERIIFPFEGDKDVLLSSLNLVLSKLNTMKDDPTMNISTIDLRFKNPVLR